MAGAEVLVEGRAIGQSIGAGAVRVLESADQMGDFQAGEVLVADMTDPDWEPIMKRAAAIGTNRGGRTCHAAIIARELGIPAVVGSGSATRDLADGREVTVGAPRRHRAGLRGLLDFSVERTELDTMPDIPVKIMMNVGTPEQAFSFAQLPHRGVGLARLEFVINRQIGIHPRALLQLESVLRRAALPYELRADIEETIAAYAGPREFFVQRVAEGVSMLAAAFAPYPVIVQDVGLQVQRVRQPRRRPALRAGRGEPDDRLPRGRGTCPRTSPTASRWSARRCATSATTWG